MRDFARKRPGMYLGGSDTPALNHLIHGLILQTIRQFLPSGVFVTLVPDNQVVVRFTLTASIPNAVDEAPLMLKKISDRLNSSDLWLYEDWYSYATIAAALASEFKAKISVNQTHWAIRYNQGISETAQVIKTTTREQSPDQIEFQFVPDPVIFGDAQPGFNALAWRLQELAYLHAGMQTSIIDLRTDQEKTSSYFFEHGILSYLHQLISTNSYHSPYPLTYAAESIASNGRSYDVEFACRFTYPLDLQYPPTVLLSFANGVHTFGGGTHLNGLVRGLADSIRAETSACSQMTNERLIQGLAAVIAIDGYPPSELQFSSQFRMELVDEEVEDAVYQVVRAAIAETKQQHPEAFNRLIRDICHRNINSPT